MLCSGIPRPEQRGGHRAFCFSPKPPPPPGLSCRGLAEHPLVLVHLARAGWDRVLGPAQGYLCFQVGWVKWMDSSTPFTMMPDTNYCNIIVPTLDTVQMSYLLHMLLVNHKPVSAPAALCLPHAQAQVGRGLASHVEERGAPAVRQTR